jgi:catechol O-methyltransferase
MNKLIEDDIRKKLVDFVLKAGIPRNDPNAVLAAIDKFCWNHNWMMHVGDVKGSDLDNVIKENKPETVLELGTYCGYSTMRIARLLPENGKIYTIDPASCEYAKILVNYAGLSHKVVFVNGFSHEHIPLMKKINNNKCFDMVFIDHDKSLYYSDLRLIETNKLLRSDSVVVADNVIVFNSEEYLNHVRKSGLYKSSKCLESYLEYDKTRKDGIEVSTFA